MTFTNMTVPLIITFILLFGLFRRADLTGEFTAGASEGLKTAAELIPILVLVMTAVGMFGASGASAHLAGVISPLAEKLGFPQECIELALIRPVSGSGAIASLDELYTRISPDSFAGSTAAVLMSSTETTFYTIAVYSAAMTKKLGSRVFIAAAAADITGFILSPLMVRLFIR
ncbi:MAG: spore maturation protein [Ruminococcus sp.]|nr:spore maturation protein [Ruminococcus sp.]